MQGPKNIKTRKNQTDGMSLRQQRKTKTVDSFSLPDLLFIKIQSVFERLKSPKPHDEWECPRYRHLDRIDHTGGHTQETRTIQRRIRQRKQQQYLCLSYLCRTRMNTLQIISLTVNSTIRDAEDILTLTPVIPVHFDH